MNFKAWLEMSDIRTADTSNVHLTQAASGRRFSYTFKFNNEDYRVDFHQMEPEFNYRILEGVYSIELDGPSGYGLTGTAGSGSSVIYTQLLLAVKKLMETVKVNGFDFTPAHDFMGLVYDRFYRQFLKKDFMRINHRLYLKKDYIRELSGSMGPMAKQTMYSQVLGANRTAVAKNKEIRDQKVELRNKKRLYPMSPGKFFYQNSWDGGKKLVFVTGLNQRYPWVDAVEREGNNFYSGVSSFESFSLAAQPNRADVDSFLRAFAASRSVNDMRFTALRDELEKHGIAIPQNPSTIA